MPASVRAEGTLLPGERWLLEEGWTLRSAAQVDAAGPAVSSPNFATEGWHPTRVPSTVVGALVAAGIYPDPYFGMNLRQLPGADYPIGRIFSKLPMPEDSPFRSAWWFRKEFEIPDNPGGQRWSLRFDGINYRAEIWLNGQRLAGRDKVAGAYRQVEFDVTERVRAGGPNVLAVEVFPPQVNDLALSWVDWNPMAPDKAMGIWRDVYLSASGSVVLRHPHVASDVDLPSLKTARLKISVDVANRSTRDVSGVLKVRLADLTVSQRVELAAGEARTVSLDPRSHPELTLLGPRLWWPHTMGPQNLHSAELAFETDEASSSPVISDRVSLRFGIRKITSELTEEGHRLFRINGRRILIRGGGWTPDMMLRFSPERAESELRYVRDMGLNTVRLEGKMEPEPFFELADRYGILVMAGWVCCSHWERWQDWTDEDHIIAAESLRSQIRRLRSHPSLLVWLNGSDAPPPAKVETSYLEILEELQWPNPVLSSATAKPAEHSGASGVKMNGPYEWVPPSYWLRDTRKGGAFGFATEVGPGPVVPPLASLREMLPESSLWPIDEQWLFHAGSGRFGNLDLFNEGLSARYGPPRDVADYAFKSQLLAYEGLRAMFEAYGRNKYTATGVIQWMLNDAWPSLTWHLYDYYLRPGGAYFGAKKACEPLHIQYSYDDRSVAIVNEHPDPLKGLQASAWVYDLDLRERFFQQRTVDVPADSALRLFGVPESPGLSKTYFLKLRLESASGDLLSSNFYWLSTRRDELDWRAATYYHTPVTTHGDLTGLAKLPEVELKLTVSTETEGGEGVARVQVENPASHLALAVRLRLLRGPAGSEVLPILWEDNYFPLFPGETRQVVARYQLRDLAGSQPMVVVDGWNVAGARRVGLRPKGL